MIDQDEGAGDPAMSAALGRLTESERTCLRRRLLPQTAKEMALDLGISPHAVEKRLKMARAKLGVSSSLQAARLLAQSERASRSLGPSPPDLAVTGRLRHSSPAGGQHASAARPASRLDWRLMMLVPVAIAAFAFTWASAPESPSTPQPVSSLNIHELVARDFAQMDKDNSGFIEGAETGQLPDAVLEQFDSNRDGRVTLAEMKAGTKGAFVFQAIDAAPSDSKQ